MPGHGPSSGRYSYPLLALAVVVGAALATGYSLWRLRAEALGQRMESTALLARALEDHLTQSLSAIDRTLMHVAESDNGETELVLALRNAPYLRSISLLAGQDRISASSDARNLGVRVDRAGFLPATPDRVEAPRIGDLMAGRDFHEASLASRVDPAPVLAFLPLLRDVLRPGGGWASAVAAVNVDYFLNFYAGHLGEGKAVVHLLRYDGRPLLNSHAGEALGHTPADSPVLQRVRQQESGHFEETGAGGRSRLTAYRASRVYPLILVVQLDKDQALAEWRMEARNTATTVAAVLLAVWLLVGLYQRRLAAVDRARAADQEHLRTLSRVVEQSPVSIVITDTAGMIQYVNPRFESVTGYAAGEVLGRNPRFLASGDTPTEDYRHMWQTIGRGGTWQGEFHNRRKDGSRFWEMATLSPVYNDAGQLIHYVGVKEDITERKQAHARLAELNRDFISFLENTSDFIYFKDAASRFRFCSQTLARITGHASWRDMIGKHDLEVFPADTARIYVEEEWPIFHEGRPLLNKIDPYYDEQGRKGWVLTNKWPLLDGEGRVVGLFGMSRDITELKAAQEQLQLAASVFTHSQEGIMITDLEGNIIDVNAAFTRITGFERTDVLGRNPRLLSSGRQGPSFYTAMWSDLVERGYWSGEVWNRRKSGEVFAMLQTISAVRDEVGQPRRYVSLFSDITEFKEHERQLEQIAHYDALTRLPNRVLLADRLRLGMAQALRRGQRLAVAYLDLDGFKAVNDGHGHQTGDNLLIALAARMRQALREGDTLARLGGDEFVAVLVDLDDSADCVPLLTRLLGAVAQPTHLNELVLQVSASIGVSLFPQAEEVDADQLLRQADQAMYQAKLAGKNRFHVFDAAQDRSVRGHNETLERIRSAMEQGEFVLHYQPKVNLRSGAVVGAEALIRWMHPERGLLSPASFLPVIEDHPLAIELGEWVIDRALADLDRWKTAGLAIPVSVNVGALQLQQKDFVARLQSLLSAHPGRGSGDLELEVVETSALEDLAHVSQVIADCHRLGVDFALDDFGTGYSSLTYLKHLPVGQLKIDQTFVRDMLDDPDDLAILEGVIGLANAFRRRVIAEGVETREHGEMLLRLGCELAQGYGIARPMPADGLPTWAASWRPDPAWRNLAPVSRDDLALLFAEVEHRAWIVALETYLRGEQDAPPPMDAHQCRFGHWLDGEGGRRYAASAAFQPILAQHGHIHALATELLAQARQGGRTEALSRLAELHGQRDALLDQLNGLLAEDDD